MDEFYFASKLYCASCLYNNEQLLVHNKQPEPIVLLHEIQEFLEYPSLKKNLHIDLFHKILTAFLKEESPDFTKIKTLYFDNIERFNDAEKSDLFMFLLRFFKEQFIKGHNSYLREIFDLYKAGIEKEIIIEDGSIAQDIFRDIVLIGCSVKEFQWTKLFIEIYKDYLAEQHRNSIVSLCKSILFFNQGNFLEALQMLNVLKDDDVFAKLQITYIQLQCYYELDYYDAFFSLTNSFSTYLCRDKKLAQPIKKSALNFTNIIKNLYNYRNTCTENFEQLKSKIEAINYIANKNWLLEKIEASIK